MNNNTVREYLERIFPVLAKNETNAEVIEKRTWHLYDMINFVEFCVFLIFRTALESIFTLCSTVVKFGLILALTYGFAFGIFYYFDQYMPIAPAPAQTSVPKLKRPSDFDPQRKSRTSNGSYPYVVEYDSKMATKEKKPQPTLDPIDSDLVNEEVVRVGSFRRSNPESGRQSLISKALDDLANIETKVNSKENSPRNSRATTSRSSNEKKIEKAGSKTVENVEDKSSVA